MSQQLSDLNKLQIESELGPTIRQIIDCARYVKDDLKSGHMPGVQLWNDRLNNACEKLKLQSNDILAKQQLDLKKQNEDEQMNEARDRSGVTS